MSVKKKPMTMAKFSTLLAQPKKKPTKLGSWTAKAVGIPAEAGLLISIPVIMTTVPELPEVVRFEKHVLLQTNTTPLTYTKVSVARAVRK